MVKSDIPTPSLNVDTLPLHVSHNLTRLALFLISTAAIFPLGTRSLLVVFRHGVFTFS